MKSRKPRRILVPIDFSEESTKTLRLAKLLAQRWRAQLDLLHVIAPSAPTFALHHAMSPIAISSRKTAHAILKQFEDFAFEQSVQPLPYSCMIRVGVAAEKINETARKIGSDLIAIATRGYMGLKYAFLGSTTAQVVRTAHCPVPVVRELDYLSASERARRGRTPLQLKKFSSHSTSQNARAWDLIMLSVLRTSFNRAFCSSTLLLCSLTRSITPAQRFKFQT